ncbi:MAG: DegV family protein [Actinomycetota bacterium]|nr:DegV family protein [Actinomycetota bacterium]
MIGVCTDSNAQLPAELVTRYDIEVVPLTVTVDGRDYLEGVDLDADAFYDFFVGGAPEVLTAAPSPGRILAAYEALAARGATEIVSIHVGSAISATCDAARIAARDAPVPVHVVDSGAASFVVGCAVWEAADALAGGADVSAAVLRAETVAASCGNVFVVGALNLARAGGRLAADVSDAPGVAILSLRDGAMRQVGTATTVEEAVALMATGVCENARSVRVGIGVSDARSSAVGDALADALRATDEVAEIVRYRVGPSVGVHTGPGTAGAVFYEM